MKERLLDRIFGRKPENFFTAPVASGEIGRIIEEAEATFLQRWLERIERTNEGGEVNKPISEKLRKEILKRDNYTCLVPGCQTPHSQLNVHHLHWREFKGSNTRENLATLCLRHHMEAHPGLHEAYNQYRAGEKNAFKNYLSQNKSWKYQPTPRVMDVVVGIVYYKEKGRGK